MEIARDRPVDADISGKLPTIDCHFVKHSLGPNTHTVKLFEVYLMQKIHAYMVISNQEVMVDSLKWRYNFLF